MLNGRDYTENCPPSGVSACWRCRRPSPIPQQCRWPIILGFRFPRSLIKSLIPWRAPDRSASLQDSFSTSSKPDGSFSICTSVLRGVPRAVPKGVISAAWLSQSWHASDVFIWPVITRPCDPHRSVHMVDTRRNLSAQGAARRGVRYKAI